jgi:hypothetical protein
LNDDKTEALLIHNHKTAHSDFPSSIQVGTSDISFSPSARNLGHILSDDLSLNNHISHVIRSAFAAIRQISSIWHFLTVNATKTLVCAFVLSRIDYCNSLLSSCPKQLIEKLQKVQNSAARMVLRAKKRDHVTSLLRTLHWLPVQARIDYKLSVLCHNFFTDSCPSYLSDLLSSYSPSQQLRSSSDTCILFIPKIRTKTYGERSFSFCAPKQWNSLPAHIRHIPTTHTFKSALKTYLFKLYYPD